MKCNNIESMFSRDEECIDHCIINEALMEAEDELAEVKRQLAVAKDELGDARKELALAELLADNWGKRAKEANDKLDALKSCREKDFELLVSEFAYYDKMVSEHAASGDEVAAARAEGRRDALRSVASWMWCRGVHAYHSGDTTLVEVGDGFDTICFYRWYMDMPMTKIEVK